MENLFNMLLVRPPVVDDGGPPAIDLTQESVLQREIAAAAKENSPRVKLRALSRAYTDSSDYVGHDVGHVLRRPLDQLRASLRNMADDDVSRAAVVEAISTAFSFPPDELVEKAEFTTTLTRLRDSITAVKYLQEKHSDPIQAMANDLRDLEFVSKVAEDTRFPFGAAEMDAYRKRPFRLPNAKRLGSVISSGAIEVKRKKRAAALLEERKSHVSDLLGTYRGLNTAIEDLVALQGEDFVATSITGSEAVMLSDQVRPHALLEREVKFADQLSDAAVKLAGKTIEQPRDVTVSDETPASRLAHAALSAKVKAMPSRQAFKPPKIADLGFLVTPAAVEALSAPTRALLSERNMTPDKQPLDRTVEQLERELDTTTRHLDGLFDDAQSVTLKTRGNAMVKIRTPSANAWSDIIFGKSVDGFADHFLPNQSVPTTHGDVVPAGVAELIVVKQQLVRYEGVDVAHIENVLIGESKRRKHSRRRETEETTFIETELTTSEERELESTSRFEMSREVSKTISEEASLKAGLTVSGKYGPTVEFTASAEGNISRSKEEATKVASSFAQSVTERSASSVTERILQRNTLKVTNEVLEENRHGFDNTGGDTHVSGVYQWVSKVYEAQMYNYGLRAMFDFMVPEPAAMLVEALQSDAGSDVDLVKPPKFNLTPAQVTDANYGYWVRTYEASDVEPPPEKYITVATDYSAGGGDREVDYNHSAQLAVPDGYRAVHGTVGVASNIWEEDGNADVVLGRRTQRILGGIRLWSTALDNERGSVPFAFSTWRLSDVAAAVEVKCQRTERAMTRWQLQTHAKLTTAYRARLSEYEEQLAAIEFSNGFEDIGQNPQQNLQMMRDELKKHCISVITDQHFELFSAIEDGMAGLPQIDLEETALEGPYVRFFEQAFEWEHMTWITYPYFWGRRSKWAEKLQVEDPDPMFSAFLKSGFCRVSVPVRPGFEGAIDHFRTFGEIWDGGPLPPISDPLYLPIAEEIAKRLDRPGEEIPQGDPWTVRVPTTLVKLRADDALPMWEQTETGEWVET